MHGHNGLGEARGSTDAAVRALGLQACDSLDAARVAVEADGFAYVPLEKLSPKLIELVELRRLLGLRTPVNTLLRLMNPSGSAALVAGAFHPPYLPLHVASAALLGQPRFASFKGGGGEAERNPLKACPVTTIFDGAETQHTWPPLLGEGRGKRREKADLAHMLAVWRGETTDEEAEATVIATTAVALACARPGLVPEAADGEAAAMWRDR
jgi:anthranilate phosphoribosyltransferase